jgi:hypothetical protein
MERLVAGYLNLVPVLNVRAGFLLPAEMRMRLVNFGTVFGRKQNNLSSHRRNAGTT